MASQIDICNLALVLVGEETLATLDESKSGRLLNRLWDITRDDVLRDHPWNFAKKRTTLAQLADAPEWGYAYQYQLPVDCLRVIGLNGRETDYRVEGGTIQTNEATCYLEYVARIEDPTLYDSRFVDALAAKLAARIAYPLSGSAAMAEKMAAVYEKALAGATGIDSQEDPPSVVYSKNWEDARR